MVPSIIVDFAKTSIEDPIVRKSLRTLMGSNSQLRASYVSALEGLDKLDLRATRFINKDRYGHEAYTSRRRSVMVGDVITVDTGECLVVIGPFKVGIDGRETVPALFCTAYSEGVDYLRGSIPSSATKTIELSDDDCDIDVTVSNVGTLVDVEDLGLGGGEAHIGDYWLEDFEYTLDDSTEIALRAMSVVL